MPDSEIAEAHNGAAVGVVNGGATDLHVDNGAALKQLPVVSIAYKAVKPHLMIKAPKAAEALEFYKKAFGAEELEKVFVPKRKAEQDEPLIRHAHLRFGETEIYVADEPESAASTPKTPATGNSSLILHICTSDVDAAIARAVEAGATVVMEPADQFWGERYGSIADSYGYTWGFSTPLAEGAAVPADPCVEAEPAALA